MNSEPPGAAPPSPPPTPIRGPVEAWAALGGRGPTDAERATVLKQMNGTQRSFGGTPAPSMFSAARSGARAFAPRRSWWATSAAPSDTGIGLPTAGIGSPSLVASTTSKRSTTWAAPSNWRFRSSDRELRPVRADVEPESLSGVHECPQDGPRPESISSHSLRSIFSMGTSPLGGRDRMGILDQAPGWKSAIRSRPLASEQLSSRPRNTG